MNGLKIRTLVVAAATGAVIDDDLWKASRDPFFTALSLRLTQGKPLDSRDSNSRRRL